MPKHLLLIGDLGSGVNLVKNLCFLDTAFDCPWSNRYSTFKNGYKNSQLENWYAFEHKTRFWHSRYGFDLSNSLKFHSKIAEIPRTVIINHSLFWEYENLDLYKSYCDVVFLAPLSDQGLRWQIRAFVEKNKIENLHNFSFADPCREKTAYIQQHGLEQYYHFNLLNMYEIFKQRRDELADKIEHTFDMTPLYQGRNQITEFLNSTFDLDIPADQAQHIYQLWHQLHWDYEQTDNWKWKDYLSYE